MPILEPDIVFRPPLETADGRVPQVPRTAIQPASSVELAVRRVHVVNNREVGAADLYLIGVVADGIGPEPIAVRVASFPAVQDGDDLDLGPEGLTIYRRSLASDLVLPKAFAYRILVAESFGALRPAEGLIAEVRRDERLGKLRGLIVGDRNVIPAAGLAVSAADFTLDLLVRALMLGRDDQIIYVAGTFTEEGDDLGARYGLVEQRNAFAAVAFEARTA